VFLEEISRSIDVDTIQLSMDEILVAGIAQHMLLD
jgi:hypothetical protein